VPYVGILLVSIAVVPYALAVDFLEYPLWLRIMSGAAMGAIVAQVSRAVWRINNGGGVR
jgi:hypothetical protein